VTSNYEKLIGTKVFENQMLIDAMEYYIHSMKELKCLPGSIKRYEQLLRKLNDEYPN
jgi:hypothetical protein